ncbi:hypothetical protein ACFYOV_15630 [Streptomyces sp. NPDC005931]|uniref:hypothetical protein n=1 Tax=Streptomyces sp. NPDC005931 TaxID=3364737 RepID=UPI00367F9A30
MKSLKAAAVIAGSLIAAGVATPAFAQDGIGAKAADLPGVVHDATHESVQVGPVQQSVSELDSQGTTGSAVGSLQDVTGSVGSL